MARRSRNTQTSMEDRMFRTLEALVDRLRDYVESGAMARHADIITRNIIVPVAVIIIGLILFVQLFLYVKKSILYPPTACDVHKQALAALNPAGDDGSSSNSSTRRRKNIKKRTKDAGAATLKNEAEAEKLLWKSLEMDPNFEPAMLSLIALYLHKQRNPRKALKVIDSDLCRTHYSDSKSIESLRDDAVAILDGSEQMVQSKLVQDQYLSLLAAVAKRR